MPHKSKAPGLTHQSGDASPQFRNFLLKIWRKLRIDENIKSIPLRNASPNTKETGNDSTFLWVVDLTPGVNVTRTLMMMKDGKACAILYAPLSSDISLQSVPRSGLPKTIVTNDSPPFGFSITRIYYKLNKNINTYLPQSCYKVSLPRRKTKIPCSRAFTE